MEKVLALDNIFAPVFARNKSLASKSKSREVSNLRFLLALSLLAINGMLLFSYIYGVNKYASAGYEIKQNQTKLSVLNEANKKLNVKIAEISSMVTIQNDFLSSNFVPAGTPKFIQTTQLTQR
ncbi:MAG: hypothetical protein HY918_03445 [Candidatus Doudnabacteria bacterium]|nr:hypothetical protein [Candidatus Doudnabacteria bacterium]